MGLPFRSILLDIFMVELERAIFTALRKHISLWKRYVDDIVSHIKEESIEHVLTKLNGYIVT